MNAWQEEVVAMLLAGDAPELAVLRSQLAASEVRDEEASEFGFMLDFWVPDDAPVLEYMDRFTIDDVFGAVAGVEDEVGFQLHVVRGRLKTLEGYVSRPEWVADSVELIEAWHVVPVDENAGQFARCEERDLVFALRGLEGVGDED